MKYVKTIPFIVCLTITSFSQPQKENIIVTKFNESINKLYISDYVYMYTFTGENGTLLIDTGYKVDEKELKDKLKQLNSSDVKYIVNTHSNGDHIGGNSYFNDAVIISHERCRENLNNNPNFPKEGLPDLTFTQEISLYFNNEEIQIIAYPGGHTNDDIILYFTKAKLVFLGDIIVADTFPVTWLDYYEGASVKFLVSNLKDIIRRFPDEAVFISSHGRDYTKEDLTTYFKMINETIDIVQNAVKQGKTLEQMKEENILRDFRFYDSERFEFINADFWIEIIYKDFIKN